MNSGVMPYIGWPRALELVQEAERVDEQGARVGSGFADVNVKLPAVTQKAKGDGSVVLEGAGQVPPFMRLAALFV